MLWSFVLYLLYGLAFFTLGIAIFSRDISLSELGIAKILWLLAAFGIIHGFHEWLELLELLFPEAKGDAFRSFRLVIVTLSFLCLLYFGIFLNIISIGGEQALQNTPRTTKIAVGMAVLALALVAARLDFSRGGDTLTRFLLAFPGALLSGIGLILYSKVVRPLSRHVAINFIAAGVCMMVYSALTGLISSATLVPVVNVQVIVFRGLSALLIMVFTIRALSVFNLEQSQLVSDKLKRFSQSEKLTSMGILAAGIAHEINNPLTNIALNAEMLRDLIGDEVRAQRKLQAIERNIERASRIAKELLHFSREKETAMERLDLNRILLAAQHLLRSQPKGRIISLELGEIPGIQGISWKLEEVFINLLLNSLDACDQAGQVTVATSRRDGKVVATITDNGHGIAEEHLGKVFDPFFTTKEVGKGTGLGLSICYNIVRQHGGTLELASRVGGGTVVTAIFPEAPDEQ